MAQTTEEQIKILKKAIKSLDDARDNTQVLIKELGDIEVTDHGHDDVDTAECDLIHAITQLESSILKDVEDATDSARAMRDKLSQKEQ